MFIFTFSKDLFDKLMAEKGVTMENCESQIDLCFISILNTSGNKTDPWFNESKSNVCVIAFDDVERDFNIPLIGSDKMVLAKAMTMDQARELVNFIHRNKDRKCVLIHCEKGVSRSGAVATFIHRHFKTDPKMFKEHNPIIDPNRYVLRLLENAAAQWFSPE